MALQPKHLTNGQRNSILQALLARSDGKMKLNYGPVKAAACDFATTRQKISGKGIGCDSG